MVFHFSLVDVETGSEILSTLLMIKSKPTTDPRFEPSPTHLTLASRFLNTGGTERNDLETYKGMLVE